MKKSTAIKLLGGSQAVAARRLGISKQAVFQWPDKLSPLLQEKVEKAALEHKQKMERLHAK